MSPFLSRVSTVDTMLLGYESEKLRLAIETTDPSSDSDCVSDWSKNLLGSTCVITVGPSKETVMRRLNVSRTTCSTETACNQGMIPRGDSKTCDDDVDRDYSRVDIKVALVKGRQKAA